MNFSVYNEITSSWHKPTNLTTGLRALLTSCNSQEAAGQPHKFKNKISTYPKPR